jgi:integrase
MTRASNGRGSIFRSSDGTRWEGNVSWGIDPATNKRIRKHVRGRTKAEVQAKVDALIAQGPPAGGKTGDRHDGTGRGGDASGRSRIDPGTTLTQWLDTWVAERVHDVRPSTLSGYRTDLKYVARSGVGAVELADLHYNDIKDLFDWVLDSVRPRGTGKARASTGTLAHIKRTLNPALDEAVRRGALGKNPVRDMKVGDTKAKVEAPYSAGERAQLLRTVRQRRNGVRWELALLGLRKQECLGLRWADVDLDRAEITIRNSLDWAPWRHGCIAETCAADTSPQPDGPSAGARCGKQARWCPLRWGGGPLFTELKTENSQRTNALPPSLASRLRAHRAAQDAERLAAGESWQDYDCVIATPSGTPVDRTTDHDDWHDVLTETGMRRVRIHDLRHTAATALLEAGIDSRTIAAIMGWTTLAMVDRYAHVLPDLRRRVADAQEVMFTDGADPDPEA